MVGEMTTRFPLGLGPSSFIKYPRSLDQWNTLAPITC